MAAKSDHHWHERIWHLDQQEIQLETAIASLLRSKSFEGSNSPGLNWVFHWEWYCCYCCDFVDCQIEELRRYRLGVCQQTVPGSIFGLEEVHLT